MRTDLTGFLAATGGRRGVVCVAPHPDDESAGCGGVLAGCAELGVPVHVVFTTDGAASHDSEAWPPRRLAGLRRREAAAAIERLGVGAPPVFLDLPDAAVPRGVAEARAVARLAALLREVRPGLLLTTWRREPHCDHQHAAEIAEMASVGLQPKTVEYLVWTPLTGRPSDQPGGGLGERLIDVALTAAQRDAKRAALACHRSQRGLVIDDDPDGFVLSKDLAARMCGPSERYVVTA